MRQTRYFVWFFILALAVASPVIAGTLTITGPTAIGLQIIATAPITHTPEGAVVSGQIVLTPSKPIKQGLTSTFYVDDHVKLISAVSRPEFNLDTTKLRDGHHALRMDVFQGMRVAYSTGAIPLQVANDASQAITAQKPIQHIPFNKVYRKLVKREIVWFNNREADLEKHAFMDHGAIYITLTDLMRHIGGNIIWGPTDNYIEVQRSGVKVRIIPDSAVVYVNGKKTTLPEPSTRIDNRTFVPIEPLLKIFSLSMEWNAVQHRADITVNRR